MRRTHHLQKKRYPAGRGFRRALGLVFLMAALYLLTAGVKGFFSRGAGTPQPSAPSATPGFELDVSDTLVLPKRTFYTIQLGAYAGLDAARSQAAAYTGRGAAGYILEDDKFRVLASAYTTQEDAAIIQKRLGDQGVPAYIYILSTDEIELRITATEDQQIAIQNIFSFVEGAMQEIGACSLALDKQEMTPEAVVSRMQTLFDQGESLKKKLSRLVPGGADGVVDGLMELLGTTQNAISSVKSQNSQDALAMASRIKYNYLDVLCNYVRFNQSILASLA